MPVAIVVVLKTQEILTAMTQAPTISAMVVIALAAMTHALRVSRLATFQWKQNEDHILGAYFWIGVRYKTTED
jgi:hypothetical protein